VWRQLTPKGADALVDRHIHLWTDVVSRACPDLVAPAASLLAFASWRRGEGPIAVIAVERALAADSSYSMAQLMSDILHNAISPSMVDDFGPGSRRPRSRPRRRRRAVKR
jgi:hypothetical protein